MADGKSSEKREDDALRGQSRRETRDIAGVILRAEAYSSQNTTKGTQGDDEGSLDGTFALRNHIVCGVAQDAGDAGAVAGVGDEDA